MESPTGIRIPHAELALETLRNLVLELVTRDGTELTEGDRKVEEVLALLNSGRAEIWFDGDSRTCNLVATDGRVRR